MRWADQTLAVVFFIALCVGMAYIATSVAADKRVTREKDRADFPTTTHYGVDVTRTTIDGVDCVVAYNAYRGNAVALSCNWK